MKYVATIQLTRLPPKYEIFRYVIGFLGKPKKPKKPITHSRIKGYLPYMIGQQSYEALNTLIDNGEPRSEYSKQHIMLFPTRLIARLALQGILEKYNFNAMSNDKKKWKIDVDIKKCI